MCPDINPGYAYKDSICIKRISHPWIEGAQSVCKCKGRSCMAGWKGIKTRCDGRTKGKSQCIHYLWTWSANNVFDNLTQYSGSNNSIDSLFPSRCHFFIFHYENTS